MKKNICMLFAFLLGVCGLFGQQTKLSTKRPPKVKEHDKGNYQRTEIEDVTPFRSKTNFTKPVLVKEPEIKMNPADTIDYDRRAVKYFSQGNHYYVDANAKIGILSTKRPKPEPKVEEPKPVQATVTSPVVSKPVNTKPIKVRGYRVQLFNGQDREQANKIRQQFVARFPDVPRYLMFVEPTFRVRVGDFFSKSEAEDFLKQIQQVSSFSDAIIIRDVIEYKPDDPNAVMQENQ
jgi:SPOR domain